MLWCFIPTVIQNLTANMISLTQRLLCVMGAVFILRVPGRCQAHNVTECTELLQELLFNTKAHQLKALDSFGRPPAGILAGTKAWFGHYSECRGLEDYQYCLLDMTVQKAILPTLERDNLPVRWGICAPANCTDGDVVDNTDMLLEFLRISFNTNLNNVSAKASCVDEPPLPYSAGFYVTIAVGAVLCALMILGSLVDVMDRSEDDGQRSQSEETSLPPPPEPRGDQTREDIPLMKDPSVDQSGGKQQMVNNDKSVFILFLLAFAFNRNLAKLMNVSEGASTIRCLHGMRVLSMVWIIGGHVFIMGIPTEIMNTYQMYNLQNGIIFEALVKNMYIAVDTFFFLSGMLVCYTTLTKLEKRSGRFGWHWFYLHRYIRLTPLLGAVLAIHIFIEPYMYDNPVTNRLIGRSRCEAYWWTDLLYIQNFICSLYESCFPMSWYLAVDMQLFLISPVIVYTLYRKSVLGIILISLLLCINLGVTGVLTWVYQLPASVYASLANPAVDYSTLMYIKPYIRMPPYLIGMVLGYFFHKLEDSEKPVIPRVLLAVGWFISAVLAAAVLFTTTGHNGPPQTKPSLGPFMDIFYQVFARYAWSILLVWVVISCQFGGPGWVNSILSWKAWIPLSRATYAAYLLHMIIFQILLGNHIQPFYYSLLIQTFNFLGVMTLTYICSVILYLAVELPVARLEELYLPKP